MNSQDIRKISVIGAGLMGHGIALEFALNGFPVDLHDVNDERLRQTKERIQKNLRLLSSIGVAREEQIGPAIENIRLTSDLQSAVAEADVVIEAVFEDLALKQALFRSLDQLSPSRAILASNSSSFMPGVMASATRRPDRVLVAHYFNPPYLLPLVEVVRHDGTSEQTVGEMVELLRRVGKTPVVIRKEAPGFVGNRLQAALFREAVSIVEQGIASAEDVDTVIRNGFGRRLAAAGIFEIWEIAGWDLVLTICEQLFPKIDSRTSVPLLLRQMVERGEIGTKAGKGFYEWTPESIKALQERIAQTLSTVARLSLARRERRGSSGSPNPEAVGENE